MPDRFFKILKHSLQVRISLALIWMFVPLAMLAGMFSYYETFHETEALQDDLLRQAALYVGLIPNPKLCPKATAIRVFWYRCRSRKTLLSACPRIWRTVCTRFGRTGTTIITAPISARPNRDGLPSCRKTNTVKIWRRMRHGKACCPCWRHCR